MKNFKKFIKVLFCCCAILNFVPNTHAMEQNPSQPKTSFFTKAVSFVSSLFRRSKTKKALKDTTEAPPTPIIDTSKAKRDLSPELPKKITLTRHHFPSHI